MQRTVTCSLRPTAEDAARLMATMRAFGEACEYVSGVAWDTQTFRYFTLRKQLYHSIREQFRLPAQHACHVVRVVCAAYTRDKTRQHSFSSNGAVVYDARTMRLHALQSVSLTVMDGRAHIRLAIGGYQRNLLSAATKIGEADLVFLPHKRRWRLHLSVELPDPPPLPQSGDVLGVDLGIVNIAATSDGEVFGGGHLSGLRIRHRRLRRKLQQKGTKSAKRLLRHLSGRERRLQADVNHVVSKRLVQTAAASQRALAVEQLEGITKRLVSTVARAQRQRLGGWAFHQLGTFLAYKAQAAGVPLIAVDPAYTSQTCPGCGHVSRKNRPTRDRFCCQSCGYAAAADGVAALNIAIRGRAALVNQPDVGAAVTPSHRATYKLPASAGGR